MSTKNLIKKQDKFSKVYSAEVVSNQDPLERGRLQVKVEAVLGTIPFWVDSTLATGSVNLLMVPDAGDVVEVSFRNKDIYSGEWKLAGNPTSKIDPNKYGISDALGNMVMIDKATNTITVTAVNGTINMSAKDIKMKANVDIQGKLTVSDACTFEGITWKTHKHPYTWTAAAGSGNTQAPKN